MGLFDKASEIIKGTVEKATQTAAAGAEAAKTTASRAGFPKKTDTTVSAPETTPEPPVIVGGAVAGAAAAAPESAPAVQKASKPLPKKAPAKKAAPKYKTVTVVKGDTLSEIAAKHGVDWREMAKLNKLENPDLIFPGQVFKIPNK